MWLSGAKAGWRLDFAACVNWRGSPEAASDSQISVSKAFSSQLVSRTVNATVLPSGDSTGEATRFRLTSSSMVGLGADCASTGPEERGAAADSRRSAANPTARMGGTSGCRMGGL